MSSNDTIVVGTDGSATALDAVRWAAELAARRDAKLRIVHAYMAFVGIYGAGLPPYAALHDVLESDGQRYLAAAREKAADGGATNIETKLVNGDVVPALVKESATAGIVVLGASGAGGFSGMLAGSTAVAVTSHAACPVVIVRGREDGTPVDGPVVIGIDGSPVSEDAIAVAFREASLRGVPLVAVHAWRDVDYESPLNRALQYFEGGPYEPDEQRLLAERLAGWQEKYPDVPVERTVVLDRPRHVLLEHSRKASLVVVGSRGRGGFRGLLLGSTSQALIHHAECPVVVVRPRKEEQRT